MDDALYRREMGFPFDEVAYKAAIDNGSTGYRGVATNTLPYRFPEYDGTDPSSVFEGIVEVKTSNEVGEDGYTHEEWLEIAGQRVSTLRQKAASQELTPDDCDREFYAIVASIAEQEHIETAALQDENPKFSRALDAWLERDEEYTTTQDTYGRKLISFDFYEDLMIELSQEKSNFEKELNFWSLYNENTTRKNDLIEGIAQYDIFIQLANHRRLEVLADLYKGEVERLYALAA